MGAPVTLGGATLAVAVGVVAQALALAAGFLAPGPRSRATSLLAALALSPLLVAAELLASGWRPVAGGIGPLAATVGIIGAAAVVAALAVALLRHPAALAPLVVGALPFRVPVAAGGQSASLLLPLYLVVAAGALAYAWTALRPGGGAAPRERAVGRIELALLSVLVLYALQSLYSADLAAAVRTMAFFYVPFAVAFRLLVAMDWSRSVVGWCFAVAVSLALLFAAVGFWEWGTRQLLLNPKVIASNQFESYFRVNSLFFDPNIYGRFLALVMLALAGVLLWTRRPREALAATIALAVLWAGLVLTFSQSSFAALLVGLALLAALRWRPRTVAATALVGMAAAGIALAAYPGASALDVPSLGALDRATSGRVELMRGGLALWRERPLLGHGSGSFSTRYRERERERAGSAQAQAASHTIPITIAAEQGLVGLALYVVLLGAAAGLLFGGLGGLRGRDPPPAALVVRSVLAAAFAGLVFHTLTYAAFLEDPMTWALLAMAVGVRVSAGALSGFADPAASAVQRVRAAPS